MEREQERRPRIVFLCIGNACRSPMAEGWLRHVAGDRLDVSSGGVQPIGVQPETVAVMAELGVDMTGVESTYVHHEFDPVPDVLIALSTTALERCPRPPRQTRVLSWPVPDPYAAKGDRAAVLRAYRAARDEIRERIDEWLADGAPPLRLPAQGTSKH